MDALKPFLLSVLMLVPVEALGQAATIPPDARIAFVSVQRISTESVPGKAAVSRVQTLQQQRATDVRNKQGSIAALQQQLDRATTSEERAKLSAQVATERTELERMVAQAQADIQNLQREVNNEIRPKVVAVLNELLKGTKIEVVTNSDTTLVWAATGLDLTNAVIARLNATASVTAPSPATPEVTPPAGAPATPAAKPGSTTTPGAPPSTTPKGPSTPAAPPR
jgi:Skp family chaperone for outer membrane proteins